MAKLWFKLWRSIEDTKALKDDHFDKTHAWIWMIGKANISDSWMPYTNGRGGRKIKRGQFHTSIRSMAATFRWSEKKVAKFLSDLEEEKMIKTQRDNHGVTVTICKYSTFQDAPRKKKPGGRTDGGTDGSTDGSTDGRTQSTEKPTVSPNEGRTDGSTNGSTDGRTDGGHNKKIEKSAHGAHSYGAAGAPDEPDIYGEPIPW